MVSREPGGPPAGQLLVIEGGPGSPSPIAQMLSEGTADEGFEVVQVHVLDDALTRIRARRPACVVLALGGRSLGGLDDLHELRAAVPDTPLIVVTDPDAVELARESMRRGAHDVVARDGLDARLLTLRIVDAVQRLREERAVEHLAFHDPTTGLVNRAVLMDRLRIALARAVRVSVPRQAAAARGAVDPAGEQPRLAVMVLELDGQPSPDSVRTEGDENHLLRVVASRLQSSLRPSDTVARLGGGEFVTVCERGEDPLDAARIAQRLLLAIGQPIAVAGDQVALDARVGIAVDDGGTDPEAVLRNAQLALHHARHDEPATIRLFGESMRGVTHARQLNASVLLRALERGEFRLVYQPTVDLSTGALNGAEVMLRWATPHRGVLWPAEFLPAAEESGVIVPIGAWVLRTALQQVAQWQRTFSWSPPLRVAVNVSARELSDPGIVDVVSEAMVAMQCAPGVPILTLEFSPASVAQAGRTALATLLALTARGVHLTLQHVGPGAGVWLERLGTLPVDFLKIDPGLSGPGEDRLRVERLVAVARTLGVSVAATAVETGEQLAMLRSAGCQVAQGHLFARAMPAKQMSRLLQGNPRW